MAGYNFTTHRRHQVVCRKLGKLLVEFTPFLCDLFLLAVTIGFIIQGGPYFDEADSHGLLFEATAIAISALWCSFALITSYYMGFCWLHRGMILFAYIVALLIYIDRWHGLGLLQKPAQWTMASVGLLLTLRVIHKLIINRLLILFKK